MFVATFGIGPTIALIEQARSGRGREATIEEARQHGEGDVAQPAELIERCVQHGEVIGERNDEDDDSGDGALKRRNAHHQCAAPEEGDGGAGCGTLGRLEFDVDRGHGT